MSDTQSAHAASVSGNIRERLTTLEQDGQRFARKMVEEVETRIPDNSKKAIDELLVRARRTRESIERRVDESLDKTLGVFNIPTRGQIEQLDRRLEDLSKRVIALQKQRPKTTATRKRTPTASRSNSARSKRA